jgi:DNA-binding beta-propeller fold protein YncE
MLALIYLGIAIALGDLICRCFYRFVSIFHRWAAAILVGMLLSTWFTYLAGLGSAYTAEPLLSADFLFFVAAPGTIFWLSRKVPRASTIAPRAPGSSTWDWITLAALFAATCVVLIGTLYVNKQGTVRLSGKQTSDLAVQLGIAQSVAVGHNFPTQFPPDVSQSTQFLFFFQAGNLEFLGLNLAWSVDVLSVLVLTSMLAVVMALGELLFNSRVVGRLGATLFFFHGSLRHLIDFLASGHPGRNETWGFWKQIAFVNQRHLPLVIGIFVLVLIFLVDQYRQRSSAARTPSDATIALQESTRRSNWNQLKRGFASIFITSARPALTPAKSFVFSGLLLAALPLWNAIGFIAAVVVLCCLFVAYGSWWSSRAKAPVMLGRVLAGTVTVCILAAGVLDLWAVYSSSRMDVNYEKEPLVKGLVFRNSVVYKIPGSVLSPTPTREDLSKLPVTARDDVSKSPVTAFQGGHGNGRGQFDSPRGIATDSAGNIFVADTGNGRIQKFSPTGTFLTVIGTKGSGHGQLADPNAIAIDRSGNIYVAEIDSKHRVQKLGPGGTFIAEWAPGLYGPRRIATGPDDSIYVVDQGRTRIVKFSPDGRVLTTWGSSGNGDGQFGDHTSVAVDSTSNKVYVADPRNSRIEIFDSNGRFLTKWSVPEWAQPYGFEDLAIDPDRGRLYASSAHMNIILVFDLQGNRIGTLAPTPPDKLAGPSGLALAKDKLLVLNAASARVSVIKLQNR